MLPCSLPPGSTHCPVATIFNLSLFSPCQLSLQHTPPLSDIFVFTDASPKDAFLTNRVESLTREKRCRVSAVLIMGKESCLMEGGPTSLTYSRVGGHALSKTGLRILNGSSLNWLGGRVSVDTRVDRNMCSKKVAVLVQTSRVAYLSIQCNFGERFPGNTYHNKALQRTCDLSLKSEKQYSR